MNILIISAHPDDMEIGMGGTAAKLAEKGAAIVSVVLTDGRRSANPFGMSPETLATVRQEEAKRAAGILGIKEVHFCRLPDLKTEEYYTTARSFIQDLLAAVDPSEVYLLHPELDRHLSHQLAGQVALEALRNSGKRPRVWAYEVWGLFHHWDRFEDISSVTGKKLQAIGEHKSQVACVPYAEGVLGLNRWRGVFADPQQESVKAAFAEVFIQVFLERH